MTAFFLNILEITVGMSALVLLMLLILKLFGAKFTAKCRYVLWMLVLIRLAIPFSLNILPAIIEVPIAPAVTENIPDNTENEDLTQNFTPGENLPSDIIGSVDTPIENAPTDPIVPTDPIIPIIPITPTDPVTPPTADDPVISDPSKEEIVPPDSVTETPREPVSLTTVLDIVAVIYVAGAVVFFAWNMLSYLIYTRRILEAARPADARTVTVFQSICAKEKLGRAPTLLVSHEINSPAAFGIFRRKVVLPDIEFSDNGLAGTLFHEAIHCKRGDLFVKLVELIARSLHWFNPLVHIAAFRCEMEMEMSCDEKVLAGVSDDARLAYGRVMLDIIRRCRRSRGALTTHFNPKKNSVKSRFANIINGSGSRNGKVLIAICLVLCIIAGTIIACTTDKVDVPDETESSSDTETDTTEPVEAPDDFSIEPTEVYEVPLEAPEGEVILQAASYGDTFLLGSECITIDGLNGDASVATIRASAEGEGYIVFGCGTYDPHAKPTERRPHFTAYHTYRVVCEGRKIIEVEEVDTITSADVLEHGKPYTGTLDGQYECSRASVFDGLLLYYGIHIDGNTISVKSGAFTSSGSGPKTGTFTYDVATGTLVVDLTYEEYHYVTDSTETINETVSGKLLEYKGLVHFVSDAENASPLPLSFSPDACVKSEGIHVISNPGGLNIRAVYIPTYMNGRSAYADIFEFDGRYVICVTHDDSYNDPTLYVIDTALGQLIHEEALTEYGTPGSLSYIDSSVALLNYYVENEGGRCRRSTEIRIENGAVQVIERLVDYVEYPRCDGEVKSPDGRYTAYNVIDDEAYHGGVDLLCPDGTVKRIKENYVILIEDGTESDVYSCRRRYSPLGFIDERHLVIIAGAYESPSGYEIYNVETGEFTQGLDRERADDYYIEYSPAAIIDGYLYLNVWKNGPISYDEEIIGIGKVDLDGNFVMLAHKYETDGVFTLPEDEYFKIRNEVWQMYDSRFNAWSMKLEEFFKSTGYRVTKKIYSADFELLLELEYPYFTLKALKDVYVYGDTCTVITFVDNSNVISASAFETAYRNAENVYSWFTGYGGFHALQEWTTVGGQSYQRCDMLEFDTLAELESITARYFSKDLTDKLMNTTIGMAGIPLYVEENGKIYKVSGYFAQFGYDSVYDYKFERIGYSDGEYSVKVTGSFCPYGKAYTTSAVCKYVITDDGSIVFTEFPFMIEELTSFWISQSQTEDSGTTVSRDDLSSIYKDVEFTTYTYDESDFYGYNVTIDIPSYCYRYNGVYLEPNTHTNSEDNIYRALLTKYEHGYTEFEAGTDLYRDANIMSVKNRVSVFNDISSENINGFFGYIDKGGTPYCLYAFYFPTDRHGEALVLYLWRRLEGDGNFYYYDVIVPIVRSVKIEKTTTTQDGGTIYFTSSPTSFLPPEASGRIGDLKFARSYIITYASDKDDLCVYYSYGLDAESSVMLKTEFESPNIQSYFSAEVGECFTNDDGTIGAKVRYNHLGASCYTDVTYELDPSFYVAPGEPNEERIYRTPVWKVVDTSFTLYEEAVASTITGKNGCLEFWHKFMGSDLYLYFITVRDEEHNPTRWFSLYYLDAGNVRAGLDLVNIEIPEDVEYDTIMPINYITGGGSMECRFYLELTKDGEVFYVAFDNFHWETGEDILDFKYKGIVPDSEIAELHENNPELFKDPEISKVATEDLFVSILENKTKFFSADYKEDMFLSEYLRTDFFVEKYTFVDMDRDGEVEMVLWLRYKNDSYARFLVLHRETDIVYAHAFVYRVMNGLKDNGMHISSGGAAHSRICQLEFNGGECTQKWLAHHDLEAGETELSYYIDNEPVTKEEYEKYYDRYDSAQFATWYSSMQTDLG